jgi:hypothetical protein
VQHLPKLLMLLLRLLRQPLPPHQLWRPLLSKLRYLQWKPLRRQPRHQLRPPRPPHRHRSALHL